MSSAEAVAKTSESRGAFIRSRLGSILAVVPLGVWTVNHLWDNLAAFRGAEAWEESVTSHAHPVAQLATGLVVLLPLVIHTIWGIGRLLTTRPNNVRYGFYANLKYLLQRLSAVGVMLFLGAHIWLAMLRPRLLKGAPEAFADISHEMRHHMPTLAVYVLGTLGVSYHLANGLHTFLMSWGIVSSRRALGKLEWLALLLFVIFLAMSWSAIYALWSAGA